MTGAGAAILEPWGRPAQEDEPIQWKKKTLVDISQLPEYPTLEQFYV